MSLSAKKSTTRAAAAAAASPTTAAAATAAADRREQIDSLKDQLIWSQKLELGALRRDYERQKETIAIQKQHLDRLEGEIFEALLRTNNRVYLQQLHQEQRQTIPPETTIMKRPVEDDDDADNAATAKNRNCSRVQAV